MMKYIVYLTVNKINHKIYVGVHRTNPELFDGYIGCGVTRKDRKHKTPGFPEAVRKYGYGNFVRRTLKEFPDTEEGMKEAYKMEEAIVNEKFIKSSMTYNLTRGGKFTIYETLKKEIAQYTIDGKFIRTWPSINEAEMALGLNSISQNLVGKSKYCGDFQWKYYTGDESDIPPVKTKEKTVYQFDMQGNLIKVWKSASEACKQFKNPKAARVAISNVCNKVTRQAYGYYWSHKCKFEYEPNGVAVAKYDDDGNFIEAYTSIREAARAHNLHGSGNINAAIKGTQKHCAGFRWRYFYGNKSNIKPL